MELLLIGAVLGLMCMTGSFVGTLLAWKWLVAKGSSDIAVDMYNQQIEAYNRQIDDEQRQ